MRTAPTMPSSVSVLLVACLSVWLSGCQTSGGFARGIDGTPMAAELPKTNLYAAIPKDKVTTAPRQLAAEGIKAMDNRDFKKASDLFNLAVKTDMTNSYLHFLNGVAYQMRGISGENSLYPLAEQGFDMAVQFDNSNWLARYFSGLLAMQQRDFGKAQRKLADAALYAGNEPELLYDLAVASYYNRDPIIARAALEGLRRVEADKPVAPGILRASAIVAAAMNDKEEARSFLDRLRGAAIGVDEMKAVEGRVDSWLQSHQHASVIKTQFYGGTGGFPGGSGGGFPGSNSAGGFPGATGGGFPGASGSGFPGFPGGSNSPGGAFVGKEMAVVDVSIISTEEDDSRSMGVNLLDGLRIQFGNPNSGTPGYSRSVLRDNTGAATSTTDRTITTDNLGVIPNTDVTTQTLSNTLGQGGNVITRLIQIPALTYSLNIANANAKRNEVLARPTLVALGGQPSTFFSGQDIVGAAVSGGQGSSVQIQKEVGVKLAVTPEFLPDDMIKLNVIAERTFLAIPSTSVKFDFRLDTNKTMVNANVVMKFGETLILSGLSERDQSKDRDGVPFLQDVPLVQYLFSRNLTRDYYKSVLILLTPRRAQFTNRSDAAVAAERANMSPDDLAMAEFEDKYRLWFKPTPNIGEITKALGSSVIFREFRTGDIAASWDRISSTEDRLRNAVKFLYF